MAEHIAGNEVGLFVLSSKHGNTQPRGMLPAGIHHPYPALYRQPPVSTDISSTSVEPQTVWPSNKLAIQEFERYIGCFFLVFLRMVCFIIDLTPILEQKLQKKAA